MGVNSSRSGSVSGGILEQILTAGWPPPTKVLQTAQRGFPHFWVSLSFSEMETNRHTLCSQLGFVEQNVLRTLPSHLMRNGMYPAPPKNPWNVDSPTNNGVSWLLGWCRISSIHSSCHGCHKYKPGNNGPLSAWHRRPWLES